MREGVNTLQKRVNRENNDIYQQEEGETGEEEYGINHDNYNINNNIDQDTSNSPPTQLTTKAKVNNKPS